MIMPSPRRCSGRPNIGLTSPPQGLPISRKPGNGARFVAWYNHEHRHSGIRYVTLAQRHAGQDHPMLAERHALYQAARGRNPRRWSGQTRDWTSIGAVTLNPERDSLFQTANAQH